MNTVFLWDTMDNEDRQSSLETLREKENWVIWKTKDKWTQELQRAGFHQLVPPPLVGHVPYRFDIDI